MERKHLQAIKQATKQAKRKAKAVEKAALEKAAAVAFEMEVLTAVLEVPGTTKKRKQRVAEQMIPEISPGSSSYKQGKFHRSWKTHQHLHK
jgi:hypothetical protein